MKRLEIESAIDLDDAPRFRVHAIDHQMQMNVVRVRVQPVDRLVTTEPHFIQHQVHRFFDLRDGGMLPLRQLMT